MYYRIDRDGRSSRTLDGGDDARAAARLPTHVLGAAQLQALPDVVQQSHVGVHVASH